MMLIGIDSFYLRSGHKSARQIKGPPRIDQLLDERWEVAKLSNGGNCSVYTDYTVPFGNNGDTPFTGDWTGRGHAGIGVFRSTNGQIYLKNQLTTGYADNTFVYGIAGDMPVAGNWGSGGPVPPPQNVIQLPPNILVPPTVAPVSPNSGAGTGLQD